MLFHIKKEHFVHFKKKLINTFTKSMLSIEVYLSPCLYLLNVMPDKTLILITCCAKKS